jgi:patatin-like phospholipase/acyl hydrolase
VFLVLDYVLFNELRFHNGETKMNILSIDGGGIRGIIPGQVLIALERKLQEISGDPGRRIADAFDLIAGTSTGGILACLYLCPDGNGKPKFSASDAVNLYLQRGDDIFDVSVFKSITSLDGLAGPKYPATPLESALQFYLGDVTLGQTLKPCLITSYDITRRQAKFFNKQDVGQPGAAGADFYLRDVARATSAAPTFFPPANIMGSDRSVYPLIDGGVFANNPAMCALVEAFGWEPSLTVKDINVLSLGTGAAEESFQYSEARNWGELRWLHPLLTILFDGVSETVDYQMRTVFNSAKCSNQYLRLQADLRNSGADTAMDNASESNMNALESIGTKLATDNDVELTAFARLLVSSKSQHA